MTDLDKRVATEIMGQRVCECSKPRVEWNPYSCLHCGGILEMNYSSDIVAAWMVVEKMRDSKFMFALDSPDERNLGWKAEFFDGGYLAFQYAPSAPEAICNAALAAIGAMEGK